MFCFVSLNSAVCAFIVKSRFWFHFSVDRLKKEKHATKKQCKNCFHWGNHLVWVFVCFHLFCIVFFLCIALCVLCKRFESFGLIAIYLKFSLFLIFLVCFKVNYLEVFIFLYFSFLRFVSLSLTQYSTLLLTDCSLILKVAITFI